jgi:hypothetical protein
MEDWLVLLLFCCFGEREVSDDIDNICFKHSLLHELSWVSDNEPENKLLEFE